MTLPELRAEIKSILTRVNSREVYTILLIILVGFASFGLGRLSKLEESREPVRLELEQARSLTAQAASAASSVNGQKLMVNSPSDTEVKPIAEGGKMVAAKGGTRYHFPWCSGASRIAETNKVWFNSAEEAKKAGYTPAGNCKGLK